MSPQFVDFNGDGHTDIVCGIFDGSPHVALGDGKTWQQPKTILDKNGDRIVLNQFWNFETKKWDRTNRCDPVAGLPDPGGGVNDSHLTSAIAMDFDGDGDFDLLLGDHSYGFVFLRRNSGSNAEPAFEDRNEVVMAGDKPMRDPGTVATLRAIDWDADGHLDLMVSGMGDAYGSATGGGVAVYLNKGGKAAAFDAAITLIPPSKKGAHGKPSRPDVGLHPAAIDVDNDGDLDLLVGGYSMWSPEPIKLNAEQQAELKALKAEHRRVLEANDKIMTEIRKATAHLGTDERVKILKEKFSGATKEINKLNTARREIMKRMSKLEARPQRVSFTWLYENLTDTASADTSGQR